MLTNFRFWAPPHPGHFWNTVAHLKHIKRKTTLTPNTPTLKMHPLFPAPHVGRLRGHLRALPISRPRLVRMQVGERACFQCFRWTCVAGNPGNILAGKKLAWLLKSIALLSTNYADPWFKHAPAEAKRTGTAAPSKPKVGCPPLCHFPRVESRGITHEHLELLPASFSTRYKVQKAELRNSG